MQAGSGSPRRSPGLNSPPGRPDDTMASPQLRNGYTPISNELLEAIIRAPLSARELKILLALARETYGWQRKTTAISTYRIATLTGLQHTKAGRALRGLKARKIVVNGSGGLGVQKDYETWTLPPPSKPDPVQTGRGSELDGKTPSELDGKTPSKPDPLQRKKAREKETAPRAPSSHHTLLAEYDRLFQEKAGARPTISGREAKIVADLLGGGRDVAEVLACLRGFFAVGTRWVRENGAYTLPAFKAAYNDLLVMRQRGEL
jgi:phage replication O-like protein O